MLSQKTRCRSRQSARALPRIKTLMDTVRKYRSLGLYGQGSLYPGEDGYGAFRRAVAANAVPKNRTFEDMVRIWRFASARADAVSDPKLEAVRDSEGIIRKIHRRIESRPGHDGPELPRSVKLIADAMKSEPAMDEEQTAKAFEEFLRLKKVNSTVEEILGGGIEEYEGIELRELAKDILARAEEAREFSPDAPKTLREIAIEEIWKVRNKRF